MKKLLSWVKAVVYGARARLRSRCSGVRHQFSFLTLTESYTDLAADHLAPSGTLSDDHVNDDQCNDGSGGGSCRIDCREGNVFCEEGEEEQEEQEEEDRLVREEEGTEEEESRVWRTCGRRMGRVTVVSLLWSLLSLLVAAACAFSFLHPSWVAHPDRLHSFGLFTQCVRDDPHPSTSSPSHSPSSSYPQAVCHGYGAEGRVDLGSVPAGAWQASTLLYGGGVCLQGVGALVSLLLLLLPPSTSSHHPFHGGGVARRVALLCGYVQTLAVLLLLSGLVMFPLGFSTPFFQYYCGDGAGVFCLGHCRMGWSYVLAITATALAMFCPVLSNYTDLSLLTKDSGEKGEGQSDRKKKLKGKKREREKGIISVACSAVMVHPVEENP
ncbi:LHFPL tetraspan subfamily member 5 protein-like [Babylonia areolata]|uniref:LHFPL tetraspan subfamily member 5 protein-like n=1 Tax=Babylonia areolata TaxID=304850 RepID=UPI003FD2C9A1